MTHSPFMLPIIRNRLGACSDIGKSSRTSVEMCLASRHRTMIPFD